MARMSQDPASERSSPDHPAPDRVAADAAVPRPAAHAAVPPRTASGAAQPRQPSARGSSLALALLLALIAVAAAGYVAWRQWQQEQGNASDSRAVAALQDRIGTLEGAFDSQAGERTLLRQRLGDADQVNRALREELLGQSERLRNLEDAVAKLSEKSLSGHDTLLLDETESLLRMAQQRYALFNDAQGAAAAYALADQSLAAVNDGAFSGLRQSIQAEREALVDRQAQTRAAALATLQRLRGGLAALPLKPADLPATAPADSAWSRVRHALASVVSVQRDSGAPLAVADARLTRELVALDLAQAQAALLAWDDEAAGAALRRVDASLAAQFDPDAAPVQQARASLTTLLAALKPGHSIQLGAALTELRNLRAVHALQPPEAPPARAAAPARSGSAGATP